MPIITVELVVDPDRAPADDLAQSLADAIGRVVDSPPGQTWVRCRSLGRHEYAENGAPVDVAELPVFVTVLERQPPDGAALAAEGTALAQTVAQVVGRPVACVHIEY